MTPASSSRTTLIVSSEAGPGRARTCEPITVGVPMPRGLVTEPRRIALVDGDGKPVPLQALPTERWPDGSIRWALLDFQANGPVAADRRYRADLPWRHDGIACAAPAGDGNRRSESPSTPARRDSSCSRGWRFRSRPRPPAARCPIDAPSGAFVVTDQRGRSWRARITKVEVEDRGELRSSVRLDGFVGPRHRPLLQLIARVHFFAGSAAARVVDHAPKPAPRAAPRRLLGAGRSRIGLHASDASLHIVAADGHHVGRMRAGTRT